MRKSRPRFEQYVSIDRESLPREVRVDPERKLLVAMIYRSILDYISGPGKPGGAWESERSLRELDACEFLFSDSKEPWSLHWICSWLHEEPDWFAQEIKQGALDMKTNHRKRLGFRAVHYRNHVGHYKVKGKKVHINLAAA